MFVNMIMAVLQEFFRNTLTVRWINELGRISFVDIAENIKKSDLECGRLAGFCQAAGIDAPKEDVRVCHVCKQNFHVNKHGFFCCSGKTASPTASRGSTTQFIVLPIVLLRCLAISRKFSRNGSRTGAFMFMLMFIRS